MLDHFSVWRDANQISEAWGDVEYLYPNIKKKHEKVLHDKRVGVIINNNPQGPVMLKYGHMNWGFKETPTEKQGSLFMSEFSCVTGARMQKFFQKHRCLIPVDRWQFSKKDGAGYILRTACPIEKVPMAFAGIYNSFELPDGRKQGTVAILGIAATEFYRDFENEMPAIFLPGPEAVQWLDYNTKEHKAWELARAFPADRMQIDLKEDG